MNDFWRPLSYKREFHSTRDAETRLRILFWFWGRQGAGSKITFELIKAVNSFDTVHSFVSAVSGCELARRICDMKAPPALHEIQTFSGEKDSLKGKLAAAWGLMRLPKISRQFEAFVIANRIDVAVCTMPAIWDVAVLPVLRRRMLPFVLLVHDPSPHPGDNYPLRRMGWRKEIKAADRLLVLSDHVRKEVIRLHGVRSSRISLVPHGTMEFGTSDVRRLPRHRPLRLLFLGRILPYKGLDLLLDAYRALRAQGMPLELEIVGSGDISPYAARLDGLDGVRLTNRWLEESEIGEALARADLMVLPYVEASQSGVAAAALAAAMPTVATPVGGLSEQIRHGETGLIADSVTAQSIGVAIRRFVEDEDLYARCSARALAHAHQDLGWDAIAARIVGVAADAAMQASRNEFTR
jgi:glycosyltransferase involved in cell wall biosynthesis